MSESSFTPSGPYPSSQDEMSKPRETGNFSPSPLQSWRHLPPEMGTWIQGFLGLSLQTVAHCFSKELSFPAVGGRDRLMWLLWRRAPHAVSHSCAGSRIKHEAVPPGGAGTTLWPVRWSFCRLWPQAYSSSCPFPITFHPPVQDQVSPLLSQLQVHPIWLHN